MWKVVPFVGILMTVCVNAWLGVCRNSIAYIGDDGVLRLKKSISKNERKLGSLLDHRQELIDALSSAMAFAAVAMVLCFVFAFDCDANPIKKLASLHFDTNSWFVWLCVCVIATVLLLSMCEWAIKQQLGKSNELFLLKSTPYLLLVLKLMKPFSKLSGFSLKNTSDIGVDEISTALETSIQHGDKTEMLQNILSFGDIEVNEVMTPRHAIVAVEKSQSFEDLKKIVVDSNFSRIPVYDGNLDNMYGIVYVKDLIVHINKNNSFHWIKLVKRITFVPENKKVSDLLGEFQTQKIHMAAVCDEYGGISGLVTMEDILEEIVGEISDEFDTDDDKEYKKLDDFNYVFDGKVLLNDFYKITGVDDTYFDEIKGDAESLAGIILELRRGFPSQGETFAYKDLRFKIDSFNNYRVEKIRVHIGKNINR